MIIVKTILSSWSYRGIHTMPAKKGGGLFHTMQTPRYTNKPLEFVRIVNSCQNKKITTIVCVTRKIHTSLVTYLRNSFAFFIENLETIHARAFSQYNKLHAGLETISFSIPVISQCAPPRSLLTTK